MGRRGLTCGSDLSTLKRSPDIGDTAATTFRDRAGSKKALDKGLFHCPGMRRSHHLPGRESRIRRGDTAVAKGKRTFQPNNRRRARVHGFRLRMRTRAGRAIVSSRRRKGRGSLTA